MNDANVSKDSAGSEPGRGLLPFVVGAAVVAGVIALPAALAWGFLHPPRRFHRQTPRTALGLDYERVRLRAADGVPLSGWFVPPPGDLGDARGMVVISHGYSGNRQKMLPYLDFLHAAGYAAFLFDFRAHGWSGGKMATFGHQEPLDLRAALDWAENHPVLGRLPLALLGESMGASVSLLLAADDLRVRAVVADSPYSRFDAAVESHLQVALGAAAPYVTPHARRVGERVSGFRADEIAPIDAVQKIAPRPVLLIHGTADRLVTVENSRRIHAAAPNNTTLWEVEGTAHVQSVYDAGAEYARRVVDFLEAALAPGMNSGSTI